MQKPYVVFLSLLDRPGTDTGVLRSEAGQQCGQGVPCADGANGIFGLSEPLSFVQRRLPTLLEPAAQLASLIPGLGGA